MKTNDVNLGLNMPSSRNPITNPVTLQRLEGLGLFIGGFYLWITLGSSWWMFLVLLLLPDISMLGYLVNPRVGAALYNLVHSYFLWLLLLALGYLLHQPVLVLVSVLCLSHNGLDRMLGYGLKYPSSFKHTHLGNLE
jgi:hypothetical protein